LRVAGSESDIESQQACRLVVNKWIGKQPIKSHLRTKP
jgi:hypothetical protein